MNNQAHHFTAGNCKIARPLEYTIHLSFTDHLDLDDGNCFKQGWDRIGTKHPTTTDHGPAFACVPAQAPL